MPGGGIGSAVTRRLKAAGFNIGQAAYRKKRPGAYVRATGEFISVLVDRDDPRANSCEAFEIAMLVCDWPQVEQRAVSHRDDNDGASHVWFTYRPESES